MLALNIQVDYLNQRVSELETYIHNLKIMTIPQRIICELRKINHRDNLANRFTLPMTKGELSDLVGIEPETMSRNLPKLAQHGVALENRNVSFFDYDQMKKSVCGQCPGKNSCPAFSH